MTPVVTWSLEAIAIGPKGQQMDVQIGFEAEEPDIEAAKATLEASVWASFPMIFEVDPLRVEVHINNRPEEVA